MKVSILKLKLPKMTGVKKFGKDLIQKVKNFNWKIFYSEIAILSYLFIATIVGSYFLIQYVSQKQKAQQQELEALQEMQNQQQTMPQVEKPNAFVLDSNGTTKGTMRLETVKTPEDRKQGLSGRENMGEYTGMLFKFDEAATGDFTMSGMQFPLDILFLNQEDEIIDIAYNLPPCPSGTDCESYNPGVEYNSAVELEAGGADTYHLNEGDKIFMINLEASEETQE